MARAAFAGEVRLARLRIADEDVEDLVETTVRVQKNRRVQEFGDVLRLLRRQLDRGHALVGASAAQKRAELFPAFIALHQLGSRQIRSARSAAPIRSMAEAALIDDDVFTAID